METLTLNIFWSLYSFIQVLTNTSVSKKNLFVVSQMCHHCLYDYLCHWLIDCCCCCHSEVEDQHREEVLMARLRLHQKMSTSLVLMPASPRAIWTHWTPRPLRTVQGAAAASSDCVWWPSGRPIHFSTQGPSLGTLERTASGYCSMTIRSVRHRGRTSCCVIPFHWRLRSQRWLKRSTLTQVKGWRRPERMIWSRIVYSCTSWFL